MNRSHRLHFVLMLGCVILSIQAAPASAQGNANWWDGFAPPGVAHPPYQATVNVLQAGDGYVYAGGDFSEAGGLPASNIARFDGISWDTMNGGVNGEVYDIYVAVTAVFVCGNFTEAGGIPAKYVAKYEGGHWFPLGFEEFSAPVYCFASYHGSIYAGGKFWDYGTEEYRCTARWNGADWVDLEGTSDPYCNDCYPLAIYDLKQFGDHLWGCGTFDYVSPDHTRNIAAFNEDDGWFAVGAPDGGGIWGYYDRVTDLETHNTSLYIGGPFAYVEDHLSQSLAWASPARSLHTVPDYSDEEPDHSNYTVNAVHEWNGHLYVASSEWIATLSNTDTWGDRLAEAEMVDCLAGMGGDLYAGINILNGTNFMDVVGRWDGDGWRRCGLGLTGRSDYTDRGMSLCTYEGDIIAGGGNSFTVLSEPEHYHGKCYNIARKHGEVWLPMDDGMVDDVHDVIVFQDDLYACGEFSWASGESNPGFVRWNGSSWEAPLGGLEGGWEEGYAMVEWQDKLVIGGHFSGAGGVTADDLIAWDGVSYSPIDGSEMNGTVRSLCVYEGDLIVGGTFSTLGGEPVGRIAAWDGSGWSTMAGGVPEGGVMALGEWGGDLYMGGYFDTVGGITAAGIARWDGASWSPLGDGVTGEWSSAGAYAIKGTDVGLFVGGNFETAGGAPAANIARWTGTGWETLGDGITNTDGSALVRDFLVHAGELYIAGDFTHAGGKLSINIARWRETMVPVALQRMTLTQLPDGVRIDWEAGAASAPEFQLTAGCDGLEWQIPVDPVRPGLYTALDRSPNLTDGRRVEYSLHGRESGESWTLLRRESLLLDLIPGPQLTLDLYPNPANPRFNIAFSLQETGPVELAVYDVAGRKIGLVASGRLEKGPHNLTWDGLDDRGHELSSGVYLLRLSTAEGQVTRRAILLR